MSIHLEINSRASVAFNSMVSNNLHNIFEFTFQLQNLKYYFDGESELEGMLEPVTPTLPQIPEDKRKDFMKELVEEYRKVSPKISRQNGECDVWDSHNLVVVLRKIR